MAIICIIFAVGLAYAEKNVDALWQKRILIFSCVANVITAADMIYTRYPYAFKLMPYGYDLMNY